MFKDKDPFIHPFITKLSAYYVPDSAPDKRNGTEKEKKRFSALMELTTEWRRQTTIKQMNIL